LKKKNNNNNKKKKKEEKFKKIVGHVSLLNMGGWLEYTKDLEKYFGALNGLFYLFLLLILYSNYIRNPLIILTNDKKKI